MPKGVYPHNSERQREQAREALAKGRTPEARSRATETMRAIGQSRDWRERVSDATRKAMARPEVKFRHLAGLEKARQCHGVNWRGGNGQPPTRVMELAAAILAPLGFIPEYVIKTKGHGTAHTPPRAYKADYANPVTRVVVELDGRSHLGQEQVDAKKTEVLEALGWTVHRVALAFSLRTSKGSEKP